MYIDHIGIATERADQLAEVYAACFDTPLVHEETSDEKGMRFLFLEIDRGAYFELIEPTDEDSFIGQYLAEQEAGLHHVALATEDIEAALETAREYGLDLIDEEPRPGAWGHSIAFIHPASTGGALMEFVEHG